jgi:hypothetical protein
MRMMTVLNQKRVDGPLPHIHDAVLLQCRQGRALSFARRQILGHLIHLQAVGGNEKKNRS